jgi:peptidoglycan/xylan/chitin deacetylase (PgdA/CDA1 family)
MPNPPVRPARPSASAPVYLSFDDGPDPRWTPRILDLLASAGVQATFFLVGRLALERAAIVRRIAADGHAIGNHSYSHRHPWTLRAATAREEVRAGAAALADLTGRAPAMFRPPHGRLRRCMLEEAELGGQQLVLWSRSAVDWGPLGSARGITRRLDATQAGDVVLMHDGGWGINRPAQLLAVLPAYLQSLSRRGLAPALLPAGAAATARRRSGRAGG